MPTSAKVSGFALLLGLVFGLAWLLGSLLGPSPSPRPSLPSVPGMRMPGTP
ncbi:hypothetical protein Amsp01_088720 [Amycolatopsis sp. NBRC 101858]|uniref:hypothetical protein n=1 Tax=Amycolatopsis sp. NBRC 101858 TaxID=3032200 RepID=UPI0024A1CF50|nr:hypothetical protein [Amycolatopsis sp. NBRC 101858]GLY42849.1 hypothetical protein Amsp01_088720 [Amycolatopsis sp. NBRC 101858]